MLHILALIGVVVLIIGGTAILLAVKDDVFRG